MKKEEIKIKLKQHDIPMLLAKGMNRIVLSVRPFRLQPMSFTAEIPGLKPKHINAQQQIDWFQAVLDAPFRPWSFCISSEPNDAMGKLAAAYLMQRALRTSSERLPLWHDIMGNWDNKLIDPEASKPSMILLTNVMPNSTAVKVEKLRDILVKYTDVPKIVVTSGVNPFVFFAQYLHYPLHGCVYLRTGLVKRDIEI